MKLDEMVPKKRLLSLKKILDIPSNITTKKKSLKAIIKHQHP